MVPTLRVTSDEIQRSHFPSSFIIRISRMCFKLDAEGGGGPVGSPLILSLVSIDKTSTFSVARLFFEMAPESHPLLLALGLVTSGRHTFRSIKIVL